MNIHKITEWLERTATQEEGSDTSLSASKGAIERLDKVLAAAAEQASATIQPIRPKVSTSDDFPEPGSDFEHVASWLHRIRKQSALRAPWSTAQLRMSPESMSRAIKWLKNQNIRLLKQSLRRTTLLAFENESAPYRIHFGLFLLWLEAEIARRYAREGTLWAAVRLTLTSGGVSEDFVRILFNVGGQPNISHKEALEDSARFFGLRHIFDDPDHQSWFITIFLQFGFTLHGAKGNLADWLCGFNRPLAIKYLLESSELRDDSFTFLWRGFRSLRMQQAPEAQVRAFADRSPWVLRESLDSILDWAQRASRFGSSEGGFDLDEADRKIFSQSVLRWTEGEGPVFESLFFGGTRAELEPYSYNLFANDREISSVAYNPEIGHNLATGEVLCFLPKDALPSISLEFKRGNETRYTEELRLWDELEDINLFDLSNGERLEDPFTAVLKEGFTYVLLIPSYLSVDGPPPFSHPVAPGSSWHLHRFIFFSETPPIVTDDGAEIWRGRHDEESMAWADALRNLKLDLICSDGELNSEKTSKALIRGNLSRDIEILSITCGKKLLSSKSFPTPRFDFTSDEIARGITLVVKVRYRDKNRSIRRKLVWPQNHVVRIGSAGPRILNTKRTIFTASAASTIFSFNLYPNDFVDRPFLLEGDRVIGRMPKSPQALVGLSGYGAPLGIWSGIFNQAGDCLLSLSREVMDTGVIKSCLIDISQTQGTLVLRNRLQATDEHQILILSEDGTTISAGIRTDEEDSSLWHLTWDKPSKPAAIGIFYEGMHIGSYWDYETWPTAMEQMAFKQPCDAALMMKSMKCPFLSSHHLERMRTLVLQNISAFIEIWGFDSNRKIAGVLVRTDSNSAWNEALTAFFGTAPLPIETSLAMTTVEHLTARFDSENALDGLTSVCSFLAEINPYLMAALIRPNLRTRGLTEACQKRLLHGMTFSQALEMAEKIEGQAKNFVDKLVRDASKFEGVDPFCIPNRKRALHFRIYRALIGHKLLD